MLFAVSLPIAALMACLAMLFMFVIEHVQRKRRKSSDFHRVSMARLIYNGESGSINIAGLMMMGIAMIFLAVGFIIYPINLDATDTILAWTYDGTRVANYTIADFTGLSSTVGIVPLLILLGLVVSGAVAGIMGIKMAKAGEGKLDAAGLMMLGIGEIFIAVGLIIFPIVLDGIVLVLDNASITSYTGLSAVAKVVPLIVLVAFISGGIIAGFFGFKAQAKASAM